MQDHSQVIQVHENHSILPGTLIPVYILQNYKGHYFPAFIIHKDIFFPRHESTEFWRRIKIPSCMYFVLDRVHNNYPVQNYITDISFYFS